MYYQKDLDPEGRETDFTDEVYHKEGGGKHHGEIPVDLEHQEGAERSIAPGLGKGTLEICLMVLLMLGFGHQGKQNDIDDAEDNPPPNREI